MNGNFNHEFTPMNTNRTILAALTAALLLPTANLLHAQIDIRVSVKFILDAGGNRPARGNLHTDDEVRA
jgi:hypothetical protein